MTLPESQVALPNATVRFKGTFKGTPPFTVKWFKDDAELMTGPTCFTGLDGLSCFLELYSVGVTMSGAYSCQVSNDAGSVRCSADLTVKGWKNFGGNSCVAFAFYPLPGAFIVFILNFFTSAASQHVAPAVQTSVSPLLTHLKCPYSLSAGNMPVFPLSRTTRVCAEAPCR